MKRILLNISAIIAVVSLTAAPMSAHARGHGNIALGVVGGVVVGAALASAVNPYGYGYPYYAAPAPAYYYPPPAYYAPNQYYRSGYSPYGY